MSDRYHYQRQQLPSTPERKSIKIPTPRLTKSKNSRLVFPTPEYTPDANKRLLKSSIQNAKNTTIEGQRQHQHRPENQLVTPNFVAKRSFDILSEDVVRESATDSDKDNEIFIRPKRLKLTMIDSDDEGEQNDQKQEQEQKECDNIERTFVDNHDYNDNDSEASTEVASQIDGEFYKTSTRSEVEHKQTSFKQVMDGCMTPERTKSKHELILDDTDSDDDQEMLDAEIRSIFTPKEKKPMSFRQLLTKVVPTQPHPQLEQPQQNPFTTPESKIIESAPQVRRYRKDSFDDYASQHQQNYRNYYQQPLENFNPNEELLLINSHGDRQVKKVSRLQEPYRRNGNLLERLTKQIASEGGGSGKHDEENEEDVLEQRLIQEALKSDDKSFYKDGLHGNYSDDEGYSEAEEFVLGGGNNVEESEQVNQFMGNYFKRMRDKRRLASAFRAKSNIDSKNSAPFSYSDIPASPTEPESNYNSSEEEEAYLQRLLSKHKDIQPDPTTIGSTSLAAANKSTTPTPPTIDSKQKIPSAEPVTPIKSSKGLRMQRKKVMQVEEDKNDNYLNFGFTLGELSKLRKSKKILVFEDPKSDETVDDNQPSDQ